MKLLCAALILLSVSAHAYECTSKKLDSSAKEDLGKLSNQVVFSGLLHELTSKELPKSPGKAKAFSEHLIEKEAHKDQNAFIKLLMHTSDLKTEKPRTLDLAEVCEIVERVNKLK